MSKLAHILERMFLQPRKDWSALRSGLELRVCGDGWDGTREILARRLNSKPGTVELKTLAEHAGFEDWHVFWLRNPADVAWVVEVTPDGMFDPMAFLEARGKQKSVLVDDLHAAGGLA